MPPSDDDATTRSIPATGPDEVARSGPPPQPADTSDPFATTRSDDRAALASTPTHGSAAPPTPQARPGWPTPQPGSPQPLGSPPPPPAEGGAYAFLQLQADGVTPVAYDPCRPLRFVVNPRTAPPGGDALLAEAVAAVNTATGLQLTAEGATDEVPRDARAPFQPERYGDRWAPILVAWSDEVETPRLAGDVAGLGGSVSIGLGEGSPSVYVTGEVTLDGPQLAERLGHAGGREAVLGVLLHELAHLAGLGHVDDPTQLLHPHGMQTALQAGDRTGLALLGAGPCVAHL